MKGQIQDLFEVYHLTMDFSGAGLVKNHEGVLFEGAFGWAHRGFRVPNTPTTRFDTASVTKLFTAAAVLKLVDEGRLHLEDRITSVVDLAGTRIPGDVTLAHLLTHTSGIADDADEEAGESYEALFVHKPNYSLRTCADFLPQFAHKPPLFPAGTAVRYNNCAFILLGLAIEKVSGMGYQDYVERHVFRPCGMVHSGFSAKDDGSAAVAEGYFRAQEAPGPAWRKNIYSYPPVGTADGGAFTTVGDVDRFLRALLGGGYLSDTLTRELLRPQTAHAKPVEGGGKVVNGYGFHFLFDAAGHLVRLHKEGSNAGVAAMVAWYPDLDATSIILANQTCDVWALHNDVEKVLLA